MKLREAILKEHSKAQCNKIINWIGNHQTNFDQLFSLFLNDEYRVVQKAAWPISNCVIKHPQLIKKHWQKLILNLQKPNLHNAVKRNSLRLLQDIDIPEKYQGQLMDICFEFLQSPTEALAVKVYSMTVLARLSKIYPEIIPELKLIIEDQSPSQTAGFKSRAKKVFKVLAT
ncbi:MAG: hypothetical protein ABIN92_05825 [Ferruginibacter sp.]